MVNKRSLFMLFFAGILSAQPAEMTQEPPPQATEVVTAQAPVPITRTDTVPSVADTETVAPLDTLHPVHLIPVDDSVRVPVLDFDKADIRDVLRGLGMQYNVNIYLEPEVKGALSFYLADISLKSAIDFIVKKNGFSYMVENNIVKVYKFKEPAVLPPPPEVHFTLHDGLIDLDLTKVPVATMLRLFSDSAGLNVVADAGVKKEVTARLVAMPPEKALKVLARSNGLECTETDGVYYLSLQSWGADDGSKGKNSKKLKRLSITIKEGMVTLEVDKASLDQLVRTIAVQSGINIVMYDQLSGEITAKLSAIPIDDALRFLLQNTKFTFWKEKTIYFVGSREMNQQKTTVIIPLRHIMAEETSVGKLLPPSISKDAVVKYNSEHNSLVVIGSFDVVAQAKEFIEKIDKPIPQVLIEALVVDFNINKIHDYGFSLFTQGVTDSSQAWLGENFLPELNLKPGRRKTERVLQSVLNNLGVDKVIKLPSNFRASIHALESADIVKVHSTPQIATLNGNSASITIGETRYYRLQKETKAPVDNNNAIIGTDERFEVIKFNTQLSVTPWVMDEGYVMVKIRPEFNIPRTGGDATTPPNVDTRVIESMVRLKNGQTIVLGGQRQTENVVNRRGIPVLSGIPVLGWLFSSRTITKNETQMMIFLTPHVYYGDDNAVSPDDYFGKEVSKILDKYDIDKDEEVGDTASTGKTGKLLKREKADTVGTADSTQTSTASVVVKKKRKPLRHGLRLRTNRRMSAGEKKDYENEQTMDGEDK